MTWSQNCIALADIQDYTQTSARLTSSTVFSSTCLLFITFSFSSYHILYSRPIYSRISPQPLPCLPPILPFLPPPTNSTTYLLFRPPSLMLASMPSHQGFLLLIITQRYIRSRILNTDLQFWTKLRPSKPEPLPNGKPRSGS